MIVISEIEKRNKHLSRLQTFENWNEQISNRIKNLKVLQNQIIKDIEETSKITELAISKKIRKEQSEKIFYSKISLYKNMDNLIQQLEDEQKSALTRHKNRGKKDDNCININYWEEIRKAYRAWKAFKEEGDYILIATDNNNYCYKYSDYDLQKAQSKIRKSGGGVVVVNIGGKLSLVASTMKENIHTYI